jgi:hypothetical protein
MEVCQQRQQGEDVDGSWCQACHKWMSGDSVGAICDNCLSFKETGRRMAKASSKSSPWQCTTVLKAWQHVQSSSQLFLHHGLVQSNYNNKAFTGGLHPMAMTKGADLIPRSIRGRIPFYLKYGVDACIVWNEQADCGTAVITFPRTAKGMSQAELRDGTAEIKTGQQTGCKDPKLQARWEAEGKFQRSEQMVMSVEATGVPRDIEGNWHQVCASVNAKIIDAKVSTFRECVMAAKSHILAFVQGAYAAMTHESMTPAAAPQNQASSKLENGPGNTGLSSSGPDKPLACGRYERGYIVELSSKDVGVITSVEYGDTPYTVWHLNGRNRHTERRYAERDITVLHREVPSGFARYASDMAVCHHAGANQEDTSRCSKCGSTTTNQARYCSSECAVRRSCESMAKMHAGTLDSLGKRVHAAILWAHYTFGDEC